VRKEGIVALYRVLKSLDTGHVPGDLVEGDRFKHLATLVEMGALSEVASPPLFELPGWTTRAEALEVYGIVTINDFLEADDETLKEAFNYKTTRVISKWREEVKEWVIWRPAERKDRG
jgi:hypothetical protein